MRLVERVDTPVMFVAVRDRSDEIGPGWDHLESVLGSLRGRRFVGAFDDSGLYRCSVQVREGDHAGQLGLDCGVIPGGLFLAARSPEDNRPRTRFSPRPSKSCSGALSGTGLGRAWSTTVVTTGSMC
jgi:hypothetical protein